MTPHVEIVQLDAVALRGLGDGDQAAAERTSPVPLSPYLAGPECRRVWGVRAAQVLQEPPSAGGVTGGVWAPQRPRPVGPAGAYGPPDAAGVGEGGYPHDPPLR